MEQDYTINTGAPQAQRIYDWQKDLCSNFWFIDGEYCSNCRCNLNSRLALTKFCPSCGFMIISTQNPEPPEEE